jgi:1-pyrroline-5-carboxylate dehydrogenase
LIQPESRTPKGSSTVDAVTNVPHPANEPILGYGPDTPERAGLLKALDELQSQPIDLTMTIGGVQRMGAGGKQDVVQPHNHRHVLGTLAEATRQDAKDAIDAAAKAARAWRELDFDDRAAIFLKAADLLSGPWRPAERGHHARPVEDRAAGRDRRGLRARRLLALQRRVRPADPAGAAVSSPGVWNRTDYRPLEGFVYAITPFNFTAIAGNLPTAPALMGNTVLWKPSDPAVLRAPLMRLLEEAGLPRRRDQHADRQRHPGLRVALAHPDLAASTSPARPTFQHLWQTVGAEHRRLPHVPAAGRRDRRQGLRPRPRQRGPGG